nr:hypothetical protein [uncultured Butyrivibrio sp.]
MIANENDNRCALTILCPTEEDIKTIKDAFTSVSCKINITKEDDNVYVLTAEYEHDQEVYLFGSLDLSNEMELVFSYYLTAEERWVFHYDEDYRAEVIEQFLALLWFPAVNAGCDARDVSDVIKGSCQYYSVKGKSLADILSQEEKLLSGLKEQYSNKEFSIFLLLSGDIRLGYMNDIDAVARKYVPTKGYDNIWWQAIYKESEEIILSLFIHVN